MLLDFGAARPVGPATSERYLALLRAALDGDRDRVRDAALAAGFIGPGAIARHRHRIDRMIAVVVGELGRPGALDFGDRGFVEILRDDGMEVAADQAAWHIPPADILFIQRKISGTALLAARLNARVDVRSMVEAYAKSAI